MAKAKEQASGDESTQDANFDAGTEAAEKAPKPSVPAGEESSKSRNKVLDRASVIAGKMASASSIEGLLYGSHELTISLSAIRLAITMDRVADAIKENPELLTMKIQDAHAKLEELFRPAPVGE